MGQPEISTDCTTVFIKTPVLLNVFDALNEPDRRRRTLATDRWRGGYHEFAGRKQTMAAVGRVRGAHRIKAAVLWTQLIVLDFGVFGGELLRKKDYA